LLRFEDRFLDDYAPGRGLHDRGLKLTPKRLEPFPYNYVSSGFLVPRSINGVMRSSGSGKTIVDERSFAMSVNVCR